MEGYLGKWGVSGWGRGYRGRRHECVRCDVWYVRGKGWVRMYVLGTKNDEYSVLKYHDPLPPSHNRLTTGSQQAHNRLTTGSTPYAPAGSRPKHSARSSYHAPPRPTTPQLTYLGGDPNEALRCGGVHEDVAQRAGVPDQVTQRPCRV